MSEEPVKRILKQVGLTEKETQMYIFIAKHGILKGAEIAKLSKTDNAEVYRILKQLQGKGLLESTLESPTRFATVPFDKVIDLSVKIRRDEAALIESEKDKLLGDWNKISKSFVGPLAEKFVVIKGRDRIYAKVFQMIKETKQQMSAISDIPDLLHADRLGLFDVISDNPAKFAIEFRFLTEVTGNNVTIIKGILKRISNDKLNFNGRSPDLGLKLGPRIVIKDDEEIMLFITPQLKNEGERQDLCLWTDCKALVQSFNVFFDNSWENSSDIEKKIFEFETGKLASEKHFTFEEEKVREKYDETLRNAKEEIVLMTSSSGLFRLADDINLLNKLGREGVSVNVMAPLVGENLKLTRELTEGCKVRHVGEVSLTTIVIDGQHLFQFKNKPADNLGKGITTSFESSFYTDNFEHVEKAASMLDVVWKKATNISGAESEALNNLRGLEINSLPEIEFRSPFMKSLIRMENYEVGTITEKEIINKIINAKRVRAKDPLKDRTILYGSHAHSVIHSPNQFKLPRMIIDIWHCDKQSSFGSEDWLTVLLWLKTSKGQLYVPVAHVTDNAQAAEWAKGSLCWYSSWEK